MKILGLGNINIEGSGLVNIDLSKICFEAETQSRTKLNKATISLYSEKMHEGTWRLDEKRDPVVVFQDKKGDLYIGSGHHRIAAAQESGGEIKGIVLEGGLREATIFSCHQNVDHGLQTNQKDRRNATEKLYLLLAEKEGGLEKLSITTREMSSATGVSNSTASVILKELLREKYFQEGKFSIPCFVKIKSTGLKGEVREFDRRKGCFFYPVNLIDPFWLEPDEIVKTKGEFPKLEPGCEVNLESPDQPVRIEQEEDFPAEEGVSDQGSFEPLELRPKGVDPLKIEGSGDDLTSDQLPCDKVCEIVENNNDRLNAEQSKRILLAIAPNLSKDTVKEIFGLGRRKKKVA